MIQLFGNTSITFGRVFNPLACFIVILAAVASGPLRSGSGARSETHISPSSADLLSENDRDRQPAAVLTADKSVARKSAALLEIYNELTLTRSGLSLRAFDHSLPQNAGTRSGSISASPNPIQVCDGSGLGITKLTWTSTGTSVVEVRVNSPTGDLFAQTGPSGSWTTGKWVANGTVFYLQDVSGGLPLTTANTLATVTVGLTTAGCSQAPVYEGWHDGADCTHIFGWAADRNRLNTSISVDIYDGVALLGTVLANQSRPDVGAYLGDNGLHGFDFAVPAGLKNGQPHSITVKYFSTSTNLSGTPKSITCSTCTVPIAAPPSSLPPDNVWVEDQTPAGAVLAGNWVWDTTQKASGSQSNTEPAAAGVHQHYFYGASQPLTINQGDKLVSYVLLNPCKPPQEIMLQWNDSAGSWEHRAIWGADLIGWGTAGTASRYAAGALPSTGVWVRLEVPATAVGLEGNALNGIAFTLFDGQAWFDRAGKSPAVPAAPAAATFVRTDSTTQGSWIGTYGRDGYQVVNDRTSYPSYASVSVPDAGFYTWVQSTSEVRGLQKASNSADRIEATMYSQGYSAGTFFTINLNLTDGQSHQLALYCLDWEGTTRQQRIDILDATNNALLDSRTLTSFGPGKYLVWTLRGNLKIQVTNITPQQGWNAVVSGLFFDPAGTSPPVYEGWHDSADCNWIAGWAWDRNQPNTPINVDVYDGSTRILSAVPANVFRQDLVDTGFGDGRHGFVIATPSSLKDGLSHSITVKFAGTATNLSASPKSLICSVPAPIYEGWHDSTDCNWIAGWAWDRNQPNTPINVDVYDGGNRILNAVPANVFRQDLLNAGFGDGRHGFVIATPSSLKDGLSHSISVKFSGTPTNLNGSPQSVTCATSTNFSAAMVDPANRTGAPGEDLFSGNYNWSLPLVGLPGRAGLDLGLSLTYNSLVWTKSGSSIKFDADNGFPAPGFRLGFPVIQTQTYTSQAGVPAYLMITPSGSRVELRRVAANLYESADSSYLQFDDHDISNYVLRTPDGSVLTYRQFGSNLMCAEIKDRNGNKITVDNSGGHINTITDTLNRTINFVYNGDGTLHFIQENWNVQGGWTAHTWATFEYQSTTIASGSFTSPIASVTAPSAFMGLTKVTLADGSYFTFDYTSVGQVSTVHHKAKDNHELASTTYSTDNSRVDCPRVSRRTDMAEDWATVSTGYTRIGATDPSGTGRANLPDGTSIEQDYPVSGFNKGLTTQSRIIFGGATRKTISTNWEKGDPTLADPGNPRVTDNTVSDDAQNLRKTSFAYTSFNLVSDVTEYNSDGTTLRKTHTDYINYAATANTGRIIGLPTVTLVCDGSGSATPCGQPGTTVFSKIERLYDQPDDAVTYLNSETSEPVQHDPNYGLGFRVGRGNLNIVRQYDVGSLGDATIAIVVKAGYNTAGGLRFTIDPEGHTNSISYADNFAPNSYQVAPAATYAYPTTITDGAGKTSRVRYRYDMGVADMITNPRLATVTTTYDELIGRVNSTDSSNGSGARIVYFDSMKKVETYTKLDNLGSGGSLREVVSRQFFDGAGRVIGTTRELPGSIGGFSGQRFIYDNMGRLQQQSNPTETSAGDNPSQWIATGDDAAPGWKFTVQSYDWNGRPTVTTNQDQTTTRSIEYTGCGCAGGQVETLTDEGTVVAGVLRTRQRKIYHDVLGRPVKQEILNFDGSVYSASVTKYDARDQVVNLKDYQGPASIDGSCPTGACQLTSMTYDGYGRLRTQHTPEQAAGKVTTFDYYKDGLAKTITDALNQKQNFQYDGRHLVTNVNYNKSDGSPANGLRVDFIYDDNGNRTSMADSVGGVSYNFDASGRLTWEKRKFNDIDPGGPTRFELDYTYNLAGQLTSIASPFGDTVNYAFDSAGQFSSVTGSGTGAATYVSNFQYRAWGAPMQITYGNNARTNLDYNTRLQVTNFRVVDPNNANFLSSTFTYYPDGRVRTIQDNADRKFDRAYNYDHKGRLVDGLSGSEAGLVGSTQVGPYRQHYDYDVWNNMVGRDGLWWYEAQEPVATTYVNNRNTNTAWSYDAEGHPTAIEHGTSFDYNAAGQQLAVHSPARQIGNQTVNFSMDQFYDGDGQLTEQKQIRNGTPVGATLFLRSTVLGGEKIAEIVPNGTSGTRTVGYVYANSMLIARQQFGTIQWVHPNPATNSEGRTQPTGAGFRATELDPLGDNVGLEAPPPEGDNTTANDLLYPRGGDPTDLSGGCTIDGAVAPCSTVMNVLNSGAGEQCPDNVCEATVHITIKLNGEVIGDYTTPAPFHSYADGFSGYLPTAATYVGDGIIVGGVKFSIDGDTHSFSDLFVSSFKKRRARRGGRRQNHAMSIDSAKGLWLDCRVYAFLDTLAYSEDADYDTVVNGTVIRSGNDPSLVGQRNVSITDFSQHPNILVKVGSNLTSTAAGRYQFLHKTWSGLGLPDFSPINQDIGAIVLMQGRGVINPLLRGNVKTAITKGNGEWASLPGSRYGQRTRKMSELINIYDRALSECFALRSPG